MTANVNDANDVLEFVRTTLNSFAKWDVVTFFHNSPFASETAKNIARFAGRDESEVALALPELLAAGVLSCRAAGIQTIYGFAEDAGIRAQIADFVASCEDRDFRARAIQIVIDSRGSTAT